MAELSQFAYRAGSSVFHQCDVRVKVICVALTGISVLHAGVEALFLFSVVAAAVLAVIRIHPVSFFKELRYFVIWLFFIFIVRALVTPGRPLVEFGGICLTAQGVMNGLMVCWRLLLAILFGMAFVAVTKASEIKAAVEWFLSPFSLIPGKRIAVMTGLTIRFLPLILDQARETGDAQKARGIEKRKNPVFRISAFAVPFIRRLVQRADALAIAMEARCYSEDRTGPVFSSGAADRIILLCVILLCAAPFFFELMPFIGG